MYSKKVISIFRNPKHVGKIKDANGVGEVGNIKCGDMLRVYLKVKDNKIQDAKVETYGCVSAIAASDTMCKLVKGKTLEDAEKLTYKMIIDDLGELPKIKYHCSIMGTEALHKAIKNYRETHKGTEMEGKNMFNEKTTLDKVLNAKNGPELLMKYHVPCLGCHFASQEMHELTLGDIANAYGIDLKGLLKDLNSTKTKTKKSTTKKVVKSKVIAKKKIIKKVSTKKTVTKKPTKTKKVRNN